MNFLYPVPENSIITQTYAEHLYRKAKYGLKYYNGAIDWAVMTSTPIKNAAKGKVIKADFLDVKGYGGQVRVQHENGYMTLYAHLSLISVKVGQMLEAGEVVGLSGNTGNSSGPHLHFEARVNDVPFDPYPYLIRASQQSSDKPFDGELPALNVVWAKTTGAMYIRKSPTINSVDIGFLASGEVYPIVEYIAEGKNLWARIGAHGYVAMYHDGTRYARFE